MGRADQRGRSGCEGICSHCLLWQSTTSPLRLAAARRTRAFCCGLPNCSTAQSVSHPLAVGAAVLDGLQGAAASAANALLSSPLVQPLLGSSTSGATSGVAQAAAAVAADAVNDTVADVVKDALLDD